MDGPLAHDTDSSLYSLCRKTKYPEREQGVLYFSVTKLCSRGPFKKQKKKVCRNEVTDDSTHPFPFQLTVQAPYQEAGMCPRLTVLCNII